MSSTAVRAPTSLPLLRYIVATCVLTIALLVVLPWSQVCGKLLELAILASLATAVAMRPVRIPMLYTEVTAPDAFVFCAIAALGPHAAAIVGIFGVLGAAIGRPKLPSFPRLLFNICSVASSTCLAWLAFAGLGGTSNTPVLQLLFPLTLATGVFFFTNTLLVAGAIAIERHQPVFGTWQRSGLWTAVSSFTGMTLAFALLALLKQFGVAGLMLGVPPCWMLASFYQSHKDRLEEQQKRLEAVQQLNSQLEGMVGERTRELEQAMQSVEQSNQSLREINERLAELSRVKSEFLAKVSHELRTPLNAVLGFAELLTDPTFGPLQEQQKDFVRDIRQSGEGLLSLINDILDLSKIEAGRMEAARQQIDVGVALREVASMMTPLIRDKQLTLTVKIADDVKSALLDPGMLREIVTNLMSNAVKFTEPGGRIDVDVRRRQATLEISVRDTGIGIAARDQESVFQEFYQVDGSYARRYEGTGLGLALVKRMVELHGGTVQLESKLGAGSRFTCVLPGAATDSLLTPRNSNDGDHRGSIQRRTVVIVEDNALNRKLLRNALRARGHTILEADSGTAALELLGRVQPDIVLMDIELKDIDGLEVTRRLKLAPMTAHLPILAVSAHAHREHEEKAVAAGCVGYLRKPVRLSTLPSEIERHCRPAEDTALAV